MGPHPKPPEANRPHLRPGAERLRRQGPSQDRGGPKQSSPAEPSPAPLPHQARPTEALKPVAPPPAVQAKPAKAPPSPDRPAKTQPRPATPEALAWRKARAEALAWLRRLSRPHGITPAAAAPVRGDGVRAGVQGRPPGRCARRGDHISLQRPRYLEVVAVDGAMRRDLDGAPIGRVSPNHQARATKRLAEIAAEIGQDRISPKSDWQRQSTARERRGAPTWLTRGLHRRPWGWPPMVSAIISPPRPYLLVLGRLRGPRWARWRDLAEQVRGSARVVGKGTPQAWQERPLCRLAAWRARLL